MEYDRYADPVIEWCSALEWSAAGLVSDWFGISIGFVDVGTDMAFRCSSGSIFPGRFVHRLLPDCCGIVDCNVIGGIVMIVLCVCRSGCVLDCWWGSLCCCVNVIS